MNFGHLWNLGGKSIWIWRRVSDKLPWVFCIVNCREPVLTLFETRHCLGRHEPLFCFSSQDICLFLFFSSWQKRWLDSAPSQTHTHEIKTIWHLLATAASTHALNEKKNKLSCHWIHREMLWKQLSKKVLGFNFVFLGDGTHQNFKLNFSLVLLCGINRLYFFHASSVNPCANRVTTWDLKSKKDTGPLIIWDPCLLWGVSHMSLMSFSCIVNRAWPISTFSWPF